jgi:hypothetical protein
MLSIGSFAFAAPWLLLALAALPVLWWLLRAIPPAPRQVAFPAIRLLFGLQSPEETPLRTPWWLLLLRLLIAALVIVGLARPLLNPGAELRGSGPLLLVVDNGWAAARDWPARQNAMTDLIDQAERAGKPVLLLPTAPDDNGAIAPRRLMRAADARGEVRALAPQPWPTDRAAVRDLVPGLPLDGSVNAVWLSDGLAAAGDEAGSDVSGDLVEALRRRGSLRVLVPDDSGLAQIVSGSENAPDAFVATVLRPTTQGAAIAEVVASIEDGHLLGGGTGAFADGAYEAQVRLVMPIEVRNRAARLAIADQTTAGAVFLLDERFRRRPVGFVSGDTAETDQPLLSNLYYLNRALAPFAETRSGTIEALLEQPLAMLVLADIGKLTDQQSGAIEDWLAQGGVLLRFAGPHLAEGGDALLPVALRRGGRTFGGVMSWERPATLAPFDAASPFTGLPVNPEITVGRQVLAEPAPDLGGKTWARLVDGTPLVTAERQGEGWVVLVHTTANAAWSNLALSGLFVDMLRRIVALSQGVAGTALTGELPPLASLDGFGRLVDPLASARPVAAEALADTPVGPLTPPGFYGRGSDRRAHNLGPKIAALRPLGALPAGVERSGYGPGRQVDFKPWLLTAALLLLLVDFLVGLGLRGLLPRLPGRGSATAALVGALILAGTMAPEPAAAQGNDRFAIDATEYTRLAYVLTGDARIDDVSRSGLVGLSVALQARTAVVPGEPYGVDVERDELAFFPLLYWPMSETGQTLSDVAIRRVNDYLRHGGAILFDTRDQQFADLGGIGPGTETLRRLVAGLDLPPLVPVAPDHVLTKAFYLLQEFPGRWDGGTLWIQQPDERVNDGVSPVIIGGNDFAAAWAIDSTHRPLFPVVPGGDRQREMAFRFGINLVMYALTGNYKADQVHVPAILERLGQ